MFLKYNFCLYFKIRQGRAGDKQVWKDMASLWLGAV